MNLKNRKVFTSKFVGTGASSYEKRIYRAAVSQRLRNTGIEDSSLIGTTRMSKIIYASVQSRWIKMLSSHILFKFIVLLLSCTGI